MSEKATHACAVDLENFLLAPWQNVLEISEKHRFVWLSRDISLSKICTGMTSEKVASKCLSGYICNYLSALLDKGEHYLVLAIICGRWTTDVEIPTNESIKALEFFIEEAGENVDTVCLKALLANLYHQNEKENDHGLIESYELFEEVLDDFGNYIWIYGAYYDFLYSGALFEELIRHFLTTLHPRNARKANLFQPGIYTSVTLHNSLTTLPDDFAFTISKLFQVPSTAYILYKVILAYMAMAVEEKSNKRKCGLWNEARKILLRLDKWARRKCQLYPESIDDYVCFIVGKAADAVGNMDIARYQFKEACSYGTTFAGIHFFDSTNIKDDDDNLVKVDRRSKERHHPYRRQNTRASRRAAVERIPRHLMCSGFEIHVGPFLHT